MGLLSVGRTQGKAHSPSERPLLRFFFSEQGDIVLIEAGNKIPADGLFLEGDSVECFEGAMTGESDLLKKNAAEPLLISGSECRNGNMRMARRDFAEHFSRIAACIGGSEWGHRPTQDPQLLRSDLSAFCIRYIR